MPSNCRESLFCDYSVWTILFFLFAQLFQCIISPAEITFQASLLHPTNQDYHNTEFMGTGSTSKEPGPQSRLLHSALIPQRVSSHSHANYTLLCNSVIRDNQLINPEYHSANGFACYDNRIEQSNSLRCANQNVQALSTRRVPSNLTPHLNR